MRSAFIIFSAFTALICSPQLAAQITQINEFPAVRRRAAPLPAPGYQVSLFARKVGVVEAMAGHHTGDIFSLDAARGRVLRLRDRNRDGALDIKSTYLDGFTRPTGIAIIGDSLFVADSNAVWRVPISSGMIASAPAALLADLSKTKTAPFPRPLEPSPDGQALYLGLAALAPRALESPPAASIVTINVTTGNAALYASGLRRVQALSVSPSGQVYALVSESAPARDYIAKVEKDSFHGWPYAHGDHVIAKGFGEGEVERLSAMTPPLLALGDKDMGVDFLMPWELGRGELGRGEREGGKPANRPRANVRINSRNKAAAPPDSAPATARALIAYACNASSRIISEIDMADVSYGSGSGNPRERLMGTTNRRGICSNSAGALAVDASGAVLLADKGSGTIWRISKAPKPIVELEPKPEPETKAELEKGDAKTESNEDPDTDPKPEEKDDEQIHYRIRTPR